MKILFCIDHLRADGTQRVLVQLVEGLSARGHEQAVLCLNDSRDDLVVDRLQQARADLRFVGKVALSCGFGLLSSLRWMRHSQFDVAVTLLFASDVFGRALARAAGVPRIVSSLRARNIDYARWQRWLVRRTMRWADAVILNSHQFRDFAINEEGAKEDAICVIPNGVRVEAFANPPDPSSVRAELGLLSETPLIGSVGRLTKQKGFDILLQAVALLPRQDVHVLLVGTGEEGTALRAQAVALGLNRRVHLVGYRRDVARLLGALDLYVQPSRFEGMPNALLEAMAARRPIVASAVDGICDLIEDGRHGWLVPSGDVNALSEALTSALSDRSEAKRRATAAWKRAVTQFSVEAMVSSWEEVLKGHKKDSPSIQVIPGSPEG